MVRQFVIVNNGMTEMRGHYFETAISIAEAARDAGFWPLLVVHQNCPVEDLPNWLECWPHFRIDHWGTQIEFGPRERDGIRGDRKAMLDSATGNISNWLSARYDPLPEPPPFRQRAKGWLKQQAPGIVHFVKRMLGKNRPPVVVVPPDPDRHHEFECARIFEEDMEFLLCLRDLGPDDLVFQPTAHHREVFAVKRLVARIGSKRVPQFHLEFRHEIAPGGDDANENRPWIARLTRFGRVFFDECRGLPSSDRLHLWTDTEELADDYRHLSGMPVGVLPIPFQHGLIANYPEPGAPPYRCVYLGDVREEKGFHQLPELIRSLGSDSRVQFIVQNTEPHPVAATPVILEARAALQASEPSIVKLIGSGAGFLPREEYFRLLGESDIVLCLYDARTYRARSSGIMTEALAAGKPVVVPADTWMAHQLPDGCGECFSDMPSLIEAVRQIASEYPRYHAHVQQKRAGWLARHSPEALLACLTQGESKHKRAA